MRAALFPLLLAKCIPKGRLRRLFSTWDSSQDPVFSFWDGRLSHSGWPGRKFGGTLHRGRESAGPWGGRVGRLRFCNAGL